MSGVSEVWTQAADKWDAVMATMGDGDGDKTTPCDGWTVTELVDHAMFWQNRGAGVFGVDGEGVEWADLKPQVAAALADPANLEGEAAAMGGMPKQGVAGLITADLLIHSWDLARSLGADETLPAAAVEATLMGLQRLPDAMLRSETMFGPAIDVADDASAQDRLIAFVGRQP